MKIRVTDVSEHLGKLGQTVQRVANPELTILLVDCEQHQKFWTKVAAITPEFEVHATPMNEFPQWPENLWTYDADGLLTFARQAIDCSFNFISALPGDPTIYPPRPRPRP